MKKLVIFLGLFLLIGCGQKKTKIEEYDIIDDLGDKVWFYVIDADDGGYYSYKGQTPISNFSSVPFVKSETKPTEIEDEEENQEIDAEVSDDVSESASEATSEGSSSSDDGGGSDGGSGGDGGGGDGGGGGD